MTRRAWTACALLAAMVAAGCGDAEPFAGEGECAPPVGATEVAHALAYLDLYNPEPQVDVPLLSLVTSAAEWDALFAEPPSVPAAFDFASQRVAVIRRACWQIRDRFVVEAGGQIVVGVAEVGTDVCGIYPLAVAVPRAATPLRLARCMVPCTPATCGRVPPPPDHDHRVARFAIF
jgi:hypothetical protein